jgi:NAD(P)-dependent dehydrogenase (short-subunit alcohol dehydrogenase family)
MEKLAGKTILITGAGSGMGKSMAELFLEQGAQLCLIDKDADAIQILEKKYSLKKENLMFRIGDVSDQNECKRFVDDALKKFDKIDVLINNAGIMDDFLPVDKVDDETWEKVMNVNLKGAFYLCRLVIPGFRDKKSGTILNISSIGGINGSRAGLAYTASKHALMGLTKNIAFMYANEGIRCNAIAPGGVNTNIGLHMKPDPFGYERCTSGSVNMPRMGNAIEIAKTALFLISEDSSFINGAVVTADGGWTAY